MWSAEHKGVGAEESGHSTDTPWAEAAYTVGENLPRKKVAHGQADLMMTWYRSVGLAALCSLNSSQYRLSTVRRTHGLLLYSTRKATFYFKHKGKKIALL